MSATPRVLLPVFLAALAAAPLAAQSDVPGGGTRTPEDTTKAAAEAQASNVKKIGVQYIRPHDARGINVFETSKNEPVPFEGFKLDLGAAFTQQFQALDHSNAAVPNMVSNANANQLMEIGAGFNNATANLYLDAQLTQGIRVALTSYLSSRHHNETWVKDGFLQIDASPIDHEVLHSIMKYTTLKVGHFEINYGDAHFRRTDNGQSIYNPFVGNLILDAFTTEVGAEAYVQNRGFLAMLGVTGGEIRGNVTTPEARGRSVLAKVGFDRQLTPDLRVRLTGSMYDNNRAISNTLYGGDRAGSRYYYVLENSQAKESAQFTSGLVNPGFRNEVRAFMVNPFVKFRGLELFGVAEQSEGKAANETESRTWNQYAVDGVYRFFPDERLYVGARYNVASGTLAGMADEVTIDRIQAGAGWFVTPSILLKGEYVTQGYDGFPTTDIRHKGKFDGFMLEGVVAF